MQKPCDCDEKSPPPGAPTDSIRSAAALWVASGKHQGFIDGASWAIAAMAEMLDKQVLPLLLKVPKKKREQIIGLIRQRLQQLDLQLPERARDAKNMSGAAVAMADRLAAAANAAPQSPGFVERMRRGLVAFRA